MYSIKMRAGVSAVRFTGRCEFSMREGYKCGRDANLANGGVGMHFACCVCIDAFGRRFYHIAFMIYQCMHSLQVPNLSESWSVGQ